MRHIIYWLQGIKELIYRYKQIIAIGWEERHSTDLKGYSKEEAEFLPAVLAFQETPVPLLSRAILWTIIAIVTIFFIWSIIGKVDIVATASGKITTNTKNKIIQPAESLKIKTIYVHEGQYVKRGDLLIDFDNTDAQANAAKAKQNLISTRLMKARSEALLKALFDKKPPTLPDMNDIDPLLLIQERLLITSIFNEYITHQKELGAAIARHSAEKRTIAMSSNRIHNSLAITEERTKDYKKLADEDYISRHEFLKHEQERVEQQGDLSVQQQRLQEMSALVSQTALQQQALTAELRHTLSTNLSEAEEKLPALTAEYLKHSEHLKDLKLSSPVNGVVQQLAVHTLGGIVTPAQTLMVIVPTGEPIEIEAVIENKDIGFVYKNQEAEIKVEAFPYTKYGTLHGKVVNVSPDALPDEKKGLTYIAQVRLDRNAFFINGKTISLTPGMAVNVEIKTGKRRLIEYFLSPFMEYQKEALKER